MTVLGWILAVAAFWLVVYGITWAVEWFQNNGGKR